jgi:hypothetical protein
MVEDFESRYGAEPQKPAKPFQESKDPKDWRDTPKHKARLKEWRTEQALERTKRENKAREELDKEKAKEIRQKLQTYYEARAVVVEPPAERLAKLRALAEAEKQAKDGAA